MVSLLLLGFLIGIRHAMEPDHVAAVASLATRHADSVRSVVRQGLAWGLGHALTLSLFGGMVIAAKIVVPERLAKGLEFTVGIMLVALGADVLRRILKQGLRHGFQGPLGASAQTHGQEDHHERVDGFPLRALAVGLMHGMAGSAALILLTLASVKSPMTGLLYMLLFGVGSMLGMAMLSTVVALPLRYSVRRMGAIYQGVHGVVGLGTMALGAVMAWSIGAAAF